MKKNVLLVCLLFLFELVSAQSSNLQGTYQSVGYFFHPTASRFLNQQKQLIQISTNRYQLDLADLGVGNYRFQFDVDANNNLVNWSAVGDAPASPQSGFMTTDNPGGFSFYPGATFGLVHSTYSNRYDPISKSFWLHYGYQFGSTGQVQYQRQIYENLQYIPPQSIDSAFPSSGSYRTKVTVLGSGFTGIVPSFQNSNYLVDSFSIVSDQEMHIWIGSADSSGSYQLMVGNNSNPFYFQYNAQTVSNDQWHQWGYGGIAVSQGPILSTAQTISPVGYPFAALVDSQSQAVVVNYEKGNWNVGNNDYFVSAGKVSKINIISGADNEPIVAFVDSTQSGNITVKKRINGSWTTLGAAGFAPYKGFNSVPIALDQQGNIYVLSTNRPNPNGSCLATVYRFNNNTWTSLGLAATGAYDYITMDVDPNNGKVYIVYSDTATRQAVVKKLENNSWSVLGNSSFTNAAFGIYYPMIKLDRTGVPHVLLQDDDRFERLSLYRYNGTQWSKSGSDRFSQGRSYYPSLVFDGNNLPLVQFYDASYANAISVMKRNSNGQWNFVGNRCGIPGKSVAANLQVDSSNRPAIVFRKPDGALGTEKLKYEQQASDLSGTYQSSGYFFHPTASRFLNLTQTVTRTGRNWYQFSIADLAASSNFYFQAFLEADNHLIAWIPVGATPPTPQSGYMTSDNPGGFGYYPGFTDGYFNHSRFNNRYDLASQSFWTHYGYHFGATSENEYTRQVYQRYTLIPPQTITSISPTSGTYGTKITVRGSNLSGYTPVIGFQNNGYFVDSFHIESDSVQYVWVGQFAKDTALPIRIGSATSTQLFSYTRPVMNTDGWEVLGANDLSDAKTGSRNSIVFGKNNIPFITYTDTFNRIQVCQWNGQQWTKLGTNASHTGQNPSTGNVSTPRIMATSAGNIILAYIDSFNNNKLRVRKYESSSLQWQTLSSDVIFNFDEISMAPGNVDQIYILGSALNNGTRNLKTYRINGNQMDSLPVAADQITNRAYIDVDTVQQIVYVAYTNASNYQATVKKYQQGSWSVLGDSIITNAPRGVYYSIIKLDRNRKPHLILQYDDFHERLSMYAWENGIWSNNGSDRFTKGHSYSPGIVFSQNNQPHVIYQDLTYLETSTLINRSQNGTWNNVGARGSIPGFVEATSLALDQNSRPYVIFGEKDNNWKTKVIRRIQDTVSISACSPYVSPWGQTIDSSGYYQHTYTAANQTDSIVRYKITILRPTTSSSSLTLCSSQLPYNWNGRSLTTAGVYRDTLNNAVGCDSILVFTLTVNSGGLPLAPASITQTLKTNQCGQRVYRYTASITASATAYDWVLPISVGGISGVQLDSGTLNASRVILVRYASNAASIPGDSIKARSVNGCGNSAYRIVRLSNTALNPPLAPATVTITTVQSNVCGARKYRYTAPNLPTATTTATAATGWDWSLMGDLSTTATIDSGSLTSQKLIVSFSSNAAAGITDSIRVRFASACGYSNNKSAKLTNTLLSPPTAPTAITITAVDPSACGARKYRYSAPNLPASSTSAGAATGWDWSLMGDLSTTATIDSGSLTSQKLIVSFSSNAAAGITDSIRVRFASACGYSNNKSAKLTNTLLSPPTAPTAITITAVDPSACGARKYRYSAPNLPASSTSAGAATGWDWSLIGDLSNAATIDSGSLTSQKLIVSFSSNAAAGITDSIRVRFASACGYSNYKSAKLTNTLISVPSTPTAITITPIQTYVCGERKYRYSAPNLPSSTLSAGAASGWEWDLLGDLAETAVIDSGSLSSQKLVLIFSSNDAAVAGDSIRLRYSSVCGYSNFRSAKLTNTLLKVPSPPTAITITPIQTNVCGERKYRYSAPNLPTATTTAGAANGWEWELEGPLSASSTVDSGDLNSQKLVISFSDNAAAVAGDSIRVRYQSVCGNSNFKSIKLSNTALAVPATPTTITITPIQTNVCGERKYRYSAPNLPSATTTAGVAYGWEWDFVGTLVSTAVIDSGDLNSQKIVLNFTDNAAAGIGDSIRVRFISDCGYSNYKSVKFSNTKLNPPAAPASITIQQVLPDICGARRYRYIAPVLPSATTTAGAASGYEWFEPIGAVGITGVVDSGTSESRAITITYSSNAAAGAGDSIFVRYTSGCGESTRKAQRLSNVLKSGCLPVSKNQLKKVDLSVLIYPNPSNSVFRVQISVSEKQNPVSYVVGDVQGRILQKGNINGSQLEIGSGWKPGIYWIRLEGINAETKTYRLIKR